MGKETKKQWYENGCISRPNKDEHIVIVPSEPGFWEKISKETALWWNEYKKTLPSRREKEEKEEKEENSLLEEKEEKEEKEERK